MEGTVFGLTEQRIAELGLTWGIGGFIVLMLVIIWNLARESKAGRLARESKAGKLGTFILFFVLAFGILGFAMKSVLQWMLNL